MRALLILIGLGIFATSCDKIVAEDITEELPVLILPAVNDTVNQNPVHFKWEAMPGASKYHLEVVSPSFGAISTFPLDTIITGTNFYFPLDSNEYELRLTALNGGYESQVLGPVKFWVGVQASGGTGNNVVLLSPADQLYVNDQFNNVFQWTPIPSASNYEFSLRAGTNFSSGSILDGANNISQPTYTASSVTLTEGEYSWGVKAYYGVTESPFTVRQFFVDLTDPNEAIPSTPANSSTSQQGPITFLWANGTDSGTVHAPVTSILEISEDAAFSSPTVHNVQGNTIDLTLVPNTYYWRVTNTDEAGNSAAVSSTFQLTVIP